MAEKGVLQKIRSSVTARLMSCLMAGVFFASITHPAYAFTSVAKAGPITANAFADSDTDGDGLGDTWETHYWGSISAYDGDDDPDGDGFDNLWEFKNGTDPTDPSDPNYHFAARNRALEFLKSMMDKRVSSGKRILYSYVDRSGNTFGYGWTYDNAISAIAFEQAGEWQRAKEVLDAFIWFQDRDPIGDGRIRRAYWANLPINDLHVGDCSSWIIFENSEGYNQSVGDMAFMMIAALRYHEHLGEEDSAYLSFAKKMGDWIFAHAKSDSGAGGYNMARRDHELANPANFDRKSTENNIDAYVAFMKLYEALDDHAYRLYALHAKNFVLAMWNSSEHMFWTGTKDDGVTINGGVNSDVTGYDGVHPTSGQPEDPSTWALLALGEAGKYGAGITWVENNCRVQNIDGFAFGYDFNADRDGIWFEGSSHIALSYQMLDDTARSDGALDIIMSAQDTPTGGIPCASHNGVTTSFNLWTLSTDLHVAPAAWLMLAVDGRNPFWSQDINDPVPYEGGYDTSGDKYIFEDPWAEASVTGVAPASDGTARAMADFSGIGGDDKGTFSIADDGDIVKYEWDFDGKGTFDWSSTTTGNANYWYTEIGSHLARFRVTNENGFVSATGVTINVAAADLGAGFAPPVVSGVSSSVISGQAPLTVSFTGAGTDADGYVAGYQWDFDSNGEYDSYSETSGNIIYTFREAGAYQPTFKVTDNDGLTDTAALAIEVTPNPISPEAEAGANKVTGIAPLKVTLQSAGSTASVVTYEWDFEGDGVYDWQSVTTGSVQYEYGEPGTYDPMLRVTNADGVSSTDSISIRVRYNSSLAAPGAAAQADPLNGVVPFNTAFRHNLSTGLITKYEWDFDGDKDFDATTSAAADVTTTITRPGYYLSILRVTDDNGLSDRGYVPIVATGPDQAGAVFSSHISTPKTGQRIWGNSVTISIEIAPHSIGQEVGLQKKLPSEGDSAWADVDNSITYPYRTAIDATAMAAGDYNLRSPVNQNAQKALVSTVTVDSVNWDIFEQINGSHERVKQVKVHNNEDTVIELLNGTRCELEPGSLAGDDTLTIRTANGTGKLVNSSEAVLYNTEFTLSGGGALLKPVTIEIPYKDDNNDGIVDDMGVPEADLKLFVYNETTQKWDLVPDSTVFPDENYVSGRVSHFSIFGLGVLGGAAAAGGAGAIAGLGGGGRSCFIATATFGTPMADEVQSLRFFRDTQLLTNKPGEFVIDMYERYSPPIARVIAKNEFLKGVVRYYLRPIITFARWANAITSLRGLDCRPTAGEAEAISACAHSEIASSPHGKLRAPRNDNFCRKAVSGHD